MTTVSFSGTGVTTPLPTPGGMTAGACPGSLTVTPTAPTVSEAFAPTSVAQNTASTLTITLTNSNAFALTQASFSEPLTGGLSIESSPAPSTTCAGGQGTLSNTSTAVTMKDAYIPANGSCTITLSVDSASTGTYTNSIAAHALSTGPGGDNTASATATLTVTAPAKSGGGGSLGWLEVAVLTAILTTSLAARRRVLARANRSSGVFR